MMGQEADVNFKNANRGNDTSLHTAIHKEKVKLQNFYVE